MLRVYDGVIDESMKHFFDFDIAPEVYSSLIVCLIIIVLSIIIGILAKHRDPLKKPKGIVAIAEYGVEFFDNFATSMMGPAFKVWVDLLWH